MNKPGEADGAEVLLSGHDLEFSYGEGREAVFSGLSLSVRRGEAVLFMGPSGGGKSTLAYCLAGLYPEYAGRMTGEVVFSGTPLSSFGPAARSRKVSILFQNPDNQFCMDTVENEVLFALENINYQGNLRERMGKLLQMVGLQGSAGQKINTLSGGMKQKLALCTALATEAEMLILDEPFANLDPASSASLACLLREQNRRGTTLLIVDHRYDWWKTFLSRVIFMEKSGNLDETSMKPEELSHHQADFAARGLFADGGWLSEVLPPETARGRSAGPSRPDAMVRAEGLSLFHGKTPFLSGLSFTVNRGSVTALVGSCGSGKTTLLQALAGIGRTGGVLEVKGRAGLVFQNPRFQFLTMSVEEEVLVTLRAATETKKTGLFGRKAAKTEGPSEELLKKQAEELLSEFGLLEWKAQSPFALSQGQQRRLALLAMVAGNRPLLLLDEPTYAQDERSTKFILELLRKRVDEGLTVVMATHDLELAAAFADQILRLDETGLYPVEKEQALRYLAACHETVEGGKQDEASESGL